MTIVVSTGTEDSAGLYETRDQRVLFGCARGNQVHDALAGFDAPLRSKAFGCACHGLERTVHEWTCLVR